MAHRTAPVPQARRDSITANGTWFEDLPEGEESQDQELMVEFMVAKLSGARHD